MPKVVNMCVHIIILIYLFPLGASPRISAIKNLPAAAGDTSLIPGLGRSPGEGNGNPLQFSCLENLTDREAWRATVRGLAKESDMT